MCNLQPRGVGGGGGEGRVKAPPTRPPEPKTQFLTWTTHSPIEGLRVLTLSLTQNARRQSGISRRGRRAPPPLCKASLGVGVGWGVHPASALRRRARMCAPERWRRRYPATVASTPHETPPFLSPLGVCTCARERVHVNRGASGTPEGAAHRPRRASDGGGRTIRRGRPRCRAGGLPADGALKTGVLMERGLGWGFRGGANRSQSALHMHVLVCTCSNVRQFHKIIGMIHVCSHTIVCT